MTNIVYYSFSSLSITKSKLSFYVPFSLITSYLMNIFCFS